MGNLFMLNMASPYSMIIKYMLMLSIKHPEECEGVADSQPGTV